MLYVGTDDGQRQVSRDEGASWTNVVGNVPGLPAGTWVRHVEASRHDASVVYALFDGHQNGDFTNRVYRSADYGRTWSAMAANLPAAVVPHVLREDLVDRNLIFLGTEFGLYLSTDRAAHWVSFRANLPTVPVNDVQIHARDHSLVLATHGRGIWILDDVRPLRALVVMALANPVSLAPVAPVVWQKRLVKHLGHTGDMHFKGENPANGVTFMVWNRDSGATATLVVTEASRGGREQWRQAVTLRRGATVATWDLRAPSLPALPAGATGGDEEDSRHAIPGALVRPGGYTVTLQSGGAVAGRANFTVRADLRQDASPATRERWHVTLDSIVTLYRATVALQQRVGATVGANGRERADTIAELQMRVGALFQALETQVGP
ncbi:MAG: hypothetical protein H7247_00755, partial [Polaromonas sp.]|nr:hypothetical protein [Gemmatimonadaceae bacterium]